METKAYYSLIRFVPDPFRGEGVNLGVILLCPNGQFLEWRITSNHQRARRFFRQETDVARLRVLGRALAKRLEEQRHILLDPKNLELFAARHQDMLQLTEPRTCAVENPEVELERLYARLVEAETMLAGPAAAMNAMQVCSLATSRFREAGLLHRLQRNVEFPARYRTSPYQFDFCYQNGVYRVIHTTSFAYKNPDDGCERALVLLGEIDDVRTHAKNHRPEFQVVGAFNPAQQEARQAISEAFREKEVRLWVPDEMDSLIEGVRADLGEGNRV